MHGITAVVVGAGKFGRHYAKILSRLNEDKLTGLPPISKLVITKTTLSGAEKMAADLARPGDAENGLMLVPEKVASRHDLTDLLQRHHPFITFITARDLTAGESIHADYSETALRFGRVLCEKPFSASTGDGASLHRLRGLLGHEHTDRFGLELPMSVVRNHLLADKEFSERVHNARHLVFSWGTASPEKSALIDDLALHPWSLLPPFYTPVSLRSTESQTHAKVEGVLRNGHSGEAVLLQMDLFTNSRIRTLRVDDTLFCFQIEGTCLKVLKLPSSVETGGKTTQAPLSATLIAAVENPLKQHIVASLRGVPVVDIEQTYHSQRFLEMAHGYSSDNNIKSLKRNFSE